MAVTAVEKATSKERAEHVTTGRSDKHQADTAIIGSHPVAEMRQCGTGHAQGTSQHDEPDQIYRYRNLPLFG